jgi:hypothetical protein
MSQINDALKRAKQSQSPTPPAGVPPMSPIDPSSSPRSHWTILTALLLFIAAACFFAGPLACDHKSSPPPADTNAPIAAPAPAAMAAPTSSPAPAPAVAVPKVQGIVYAAANPVAIVNGKSVHTGDRIGDYKITAILQNAVSFQKKDGSVLTVKFGK